MLMSVLAVLLAMVGGILVGIGVMEVRHERRYHP